MTANDATVWDVPVTWFVRDSWRALSRASRRTTRALARLGADRPDHAKDLMRILVTFDLMAAQYEREMDVCLGVEALGRSDGRVAKTYREDFDRLHPHGTAYDDMPVWMEPNHPACKAWLEGLGVLPPDDPRPRTTPNLLMVALVRVERLCEDSLDGSIVVPTPESVAASVSKSCGHDVGAALLASWTAQA